MLGFPNVAADPRAALCSRKQTLGREMSFHYSHEHSQACSWAQSSGGFPGLGFL